MIGAADRFQRNEQILAQHIDEEMVLLNPIDGHYFALDEVSSRVWALCDGTRSVAEVQAALFEEYEAPADVIAADVTELLEELADERLVVKAC